MSEVINADYKHIHRGIPKGCPLSPLLGALMLKSLDAAIPKTCFYVRYMDDWVILTKTRHQLQRVVKKMHRVMQALKFKLALNKTFIGKLSKGFDFLGYHFSPDGLLGLAEKTIRSANARIAELYEQGASNKRIQQYVNRWMGWAKGGLDLQINWKLEIGDDNENQKYDDLRGCGS